MADEDCHCPGGNIPPPGTEATGWASVYVIKDNILQPEDQRSVPGVETQTSGRIQTGYRTCRPGHGRPETNQGPRQGGPSTGQGGYGASRGGYDAGQRGYGGGVGTQGAHHGSYDTGQGGYGGGTHGGYYGGKVGHGTDHGYSGQGGHGGHYGGYSQGGHGPHHGGYSSGQGQDMHYGGADHGGGYGGYGGHGAGHGGYGPGHGSQGHQGGYDSGGYNAGYGGYNAGHGGYDAGQGGHYGGYAGHMGHGGAEMGHGGPGMAHAGPGIAHDGPGMGPGGPGGHGGGPGEGHGSGPGGGHSGGPGGGPGGHGGGPGGHGVGLGGPEGHGADPGGPSGPGGSGGGGGGGHGSHLTPGFQAGRRTRFEPYGVTPGGLVSEVYKAKKGRRKPTTAEIVRALVIRSVIFFGLMGFIYKYFDVCCFAAVVKSRVRKISKNVICLMCQSITSVGSWLEAGMNAVSCSGGEARPIPEPPPPFDGHISKIIITQRILQDSEHACEEEERRENPCEVSHIPGRYKYRDDDDYEDGVFQIPGPFRR